MNPASEQKRIAFGYNRFEGRIVINEGQAACVRLIFDYYFNFFNSVIIESAIKIKIWRNKWIIIVLINLF